MERVILRREYDPYRKEWGYLAIFPDDDTNIGRVGAVPFYFNDYMEYIICYIKRKKNERIDIS